MEGTPSLISVYGELLNSVRHLSIIEERIPRLERSENARPSRGKGERRQARWAAGETWSNVLWGTGGGLGSGTCSQYADRVALSTFAYEMLRRV